MNQKKILSSCLALALASSCSVKKNMDQMGDDTHKMAGTTEGMAKTTEDMKKTTEEMSKHVEGTKADSQRMQILLRQGQTLDARNNAIKHMEEADEMPAKLAHAVAYHEAQEYQLWIPKEEEDDKRDAMITDAVKEFFKIFASYVDDYSDFSVSSSHSSMQNMSALAGALHYNNDNQARLLREGGKCPDFPVCKGNLLSMVEIIEAGMAKKNQLNRGLIATSDLKPWELEILRKEQDVVYLLKIRYNFLVAYAYALASAEKAGDEASKFTNITRFLGLLGTGKWTPNFLSRNTAQIEYNALVLEYAQQTRDFLKSVGYPIEDSVDNKVAKIWSRARWERIDLKSMRTSRNPGDRQKAVAITRVMAAYNDLARDF